MKFFFAITLLGLVAKGFAEGEAEPEGKVYKIQTLEEEPFTTWSNKSGEVGNEAFKGYIPSLIKELSTLVPFEYELSYVEDGKYGASANNVQFNGLVGAVQRGEADMAAAALTITDDRENAVAFTEPFMMSQVTMVLKRSAPYNTIEEVFNANISYSYAVIASGSTANAFSQTDLEPMKTIWRAITMGNTMVTNAEEGVQKVKEDDYVFFAEKYMAEYAVNKDCSLKMAGSYLPGKGYGIAVSKDDQDLLKKLNTAIEKLRDNDVLTDLYDDWWGQDQCGTSAAPSLKINSILLASVALALLYRLF